MAYLQHVWLLQVEDLLTRRRRRRRERSMKILAEDTADEHHPDSPANDKLRILQVHCSFWHLKIASIDYTASQLFSPPQALIRKQHAAAPTPSDEIKWVVLDFMSFPQRHRRNTQRAVVAGLPFACQWCGHVWTLARSHRQFRQMMGRAWVRLESMMVLRSDFHDDDFSDDSDEENECGEELEEDGDGLETDRSVGESEGGTARSTGRKPRGPGDTGRSTNRSEEDYDDDDDDDDE